MKLINSNTILVVYPPVVQLGLVVWGAENRGVSLKVGGAC